MEERSRLEREAVARPWDASLRLRLAELCRRLNRGDLALMWERAAAACPPAPSTPQKEEKKTAATEEAEQRRFRQMNSIG